MKDPNLRADQYINGLLTDASEQDIDGYQTALQRLKSRASTDLQQNIYQNRTQFIKISKEAEKLKGEMRALRNLMSELKTNTTALRSTSQGVSGTAEFEGGFPSTLSKRDKRSSVADRTAMWNSQLQVCKFLKYVDLTNLLRRCGKQLKARKSSCLPYLGDMSSKMLDIGLNLIMPPGKEDVQCKSCS